MEKSYPILPLRIYDDLFDQHRFNPHTQNTEAFDLVYPANELPTFQFSRTSSLDLPDHFYLRNTCNDPGANFGYYKQVPESAGVFGDYAANEFYGAFPKSAGAIYDNGIDPPSGTTIDDFLNISCDNLVPQIEEFYTISSMGAELVLPLTGSVANYSVKIIVDKIVISGGSTFSIKIYAGTQSDLLLGTITTPGIYNYSFTSGVYSQVTLAFGNFTYGDDFKISYAQVFVNSFVTPLGSDIVLDETKLKVLPMANGKDIVAYCEPNQNYGPAPGYYYYVIVVGTQLFFSEVFRVIPLVQIEKYYRLRWRNSCDINNAVLYNVTKLGCTFYNTLYLDAALFNPEYETKEEGKENGVGDFNVNFSSWKKNINFEIPKTPEFLADSLNAILLHDDVAVKRPIGVQQMVNTNEFQVMRVVPDTESILNDCFLKVNLKLLLYDNYNKSGCCNDADYFNCSPCTYTAADDCSEDYQLILSDPPEEGDGLKDCDTEELIKVRPDEFICKDGKYYSLELIGGVWQATRIMPSVVNVDDSLPGILVVEGYVLPYSFVVLEYNKDGAGWVEIGNILSASNGAFGYPIASSIEAGASDLKFRVKSKTLTCDFGYSEEYDHI